MQTSFIMVLILRIIGPKYLEMIPILITFMMARVKATPHNIRPGVCKYLYFDDYIVEELTSRAEPRYINLIIVENIL